MLEIIRNNKLVTKIILLVFIVPSFIFFGVQGYDLLGDGDAPAKVNGKKIAKQEWDNAQREQADMLRKRAGAQFDSKWIESPAFKWQVLERLITDRVIATEIQNERLAVPDAVVFQKIMEIPGLTNAEGKLDRQRYEAGLRAQGLTDQMHFAMVRHDLLQQQIGAPFQYGSAVPDSMKEHVWNLFEQEREVQIKVFKATDYQAKITDEDLDAYYKANGKQFSIPEYLDAELVILDMQTIENSIKISEADLKAYYEQNARRFAIPEERRASHILIALPKEANDSDKKAAREKANALLAKAKEAPSKFSELAKANSQDPGTASKGGDLGFFTRGKMVRSFEEATFNLKKGEVSNVVESDYGYHIIYLTDIKPAIEKPLAAVRPQVEAEIKKQLAGKRFAEAAELFANTVYEQADSLQPAADKLKLKIAKVEHLTREVKPEFAKHPILSNPKFMEALFSDDVIKNKHNTEAIEITPQLMVAARAAKYHPATVKPFETVKSEIEKIVKQQKTAALARQAGEAELAKLKEGEAPKGFSPAVKVSRQMINMTGRQDLLPIMKADVSQLPTYTSGVEYAEGYVIYRINKVSDPSVHNAQMRQALEMQLRQSMSQQEIFAYMKYLRQKAKVEILKKPEAETKS